MSSEQRLHFHQEHSGPVMEKLHIWLDAQFDERRVEPNSGLGHTAVQDRTGLWRGCLKVKALAARERSFHIEVSFFTGGSLSKSRESESKLLRLGQYRRRPERIIQPLV
jgi:hypothetical protein